MNTVTQYVRLDLARQDAMEYVHVRKMDTAKAISAALTGSGIPYELADDTEAVLAAQKPDGTYIYEDAAITDNRIVAVLPVTFTESAGALRACFRIGNGEAALTTPDLTICVNEPADPDGAYGDVVGVGRVDYMILKS